MAKKRKYTTRGKDGTTLKTTFKRTKSGYKKKEVTKKKDGTKMVRKKRTTPRGTVKVTTRRSRKKK